MKKDRYLLAKQIIKKAYDIASTKSYIPKSDFKEEIYLIINENHKTYKYITVNALLAKASMPNINPLCLQKGSQLTGAYDARSLCHNVLVPFEREFLYGALGSSNEPFLNKPARFPELNPTNAVRKGRDTRILQIMCNFLPEIDTQDKAFSALTDSLYYALEQVKDKEEMLNSLTLKTTSFEQIELFISELLSESFGGETLSLTVGSLAKVFSESLIGESFVEVHVVNQSGASSKEVSDIDMYLNGELLFTIEVKDKIYTPSDVDHAIQKAAKAHATRLLFVTGPRAKLTKTNFSHEDLINKASKNGIYLTFYSSHAFVKMILSIIPMKDINEFFKVVLKVTDEARMKPETIAHTLQIAERTGVIERKPST